jgi:hypothetical protein
MAPSGDSEYEDGVVMTTNFHLRKKRKKYPPYPLFCNLAF